MLDQIVATTMDRVLPDVLANCRFLCIYNFGLRGVYTKAHGVLRRGGSLILSTEEFVPAFLASGLVNYIILTLAMGSASHNAAHYLATALAHRST